ncbi:MAG: YlbF family regulator [Kiritimatiellae bacterium]|nr:YlbF family regulator [Kiritimatiellia bacterium]
MKQLLTFPQKDTPVVEKTKELCQTILDQPAYQDMKRTIEEFLADDAVRGQYNALCDLQDELQHKHHHGVDITEAEAIEFQRQEAMFLENPVAQAFIDAQRAMQKIEATVGAYIRKTFGTWAPADER